MPCLSPKGILNNDALFFAYAFPKIRKSIFPKTRKRLESYALEIAENELKKRLEKFQLVISDIYNTAGVCNLILYYTDTANELSLSEYELFDWKIDEISIKMYEMMKNNHGLLSAFALEWKKNTKAY